MSENTSMMDVLGTILSRLVNVALFVVITILALVWMRANTEMGLGPIALIAIVVGVLGTYLVRLLFKGILLLKDLVS